MPSWIDYNRVVSILEELADLRLKDPRPCSVAGSMFAEPFPAILHAYMLFSDTNLNDTDTFHSLEELSRRLNSLVQDLLGTTRLKVMVTYGASESTLTALYALREARKPRHGMVLAPKSAHASVFKACKVLGLNCIEIPVDIDLRVDVGIAEQLLRRHSEHRDIVAIVATLGITDNGALDPVEELAKLAHEYNVPLYVDAAFGGLILVGMGMERLLRLPGISAITMDPHKLFAPAPSSLLVVYDEELWNYTFFEAPYMPSGRQQSLLWTRVGSSLATAYMGLKMLGREGLTTLANHLMYLARRFTILLSEAGIPVLSKPWTPIVAYNVGRSQETIASRLRSHGIVVYPSRLPGVLRYVAKWCHTQGYVDKMSGIVINGTRSL